MKNNSCLTFLVLLLLSVVCYSQNKRALIVGINDYFYRDTTTKQILRDPKNSLQGCVNDAKSIKELIISRFGYKAENIRELYSAQATKKQILTSLDKLLANSKPGDQAFFYYSGHGLQMPDNTGYNTDEAIAPCDILYQKNGYIQSLQLAAIYNKFVDKKVTLTTIFDCCHSWGTKTVEIQKDGITYYRKMAPTGGGPKISSFGGNGETQEIFATLEIEPLAGGAEAEGTDIRELNGWLVSSLVKNADEAYVASAAEDKALAAVKKDNGAAVSAKILDGVIPMPGSPAIRINSNFLFMSATNDDQKAKEKKDETGNNHGVFTKALLEVYKKYPATMTAQQAFDRIKEELIKRNLPQTPTLRCAPERKSKNLLSVVPATIRNSVQATCIVAGNGTITLDKGAMSGILKGNILQDITNPAVKVEVVSLSGENNAIATATNGSTLVGHTFKVLSWYVKSDPLLKVYLPKDSFPFSRLKQFVNTTLKPLLKANTASGGSGKCVPFEKSSGGSKLYVSADKITFIDGNTHESAVLNNLSPNTLLSVNQNRPYFIYLPIPYEVSKVLTALCKKDQNLQLVEDPAQADVSFYCAYTKTIKTDKGFADKPETAPAYDPYDLMQIMQLQQTEILSENLVLAFSKETVGVARTSLQHQPLVPYLSLKSGETRTAAEIAGKLYEWLTYTAGKRGIWLNGWTRK
ncbi:MAG: caspase family protein [Sphingobacteriales bacterium]|nr:caspase family protein [Sphingobacteriales bacterium]